MTDLSRAEWRKSSYSSQSGNCVEVASNLLGLALVRDSKAPEGPKLLVSPRDLASIPPDPPRLASPARGTRRRSRAACGCARRLP